MTKDKINVAIIIVIFQVDGDTKVVNGHTNKAFDGSTPEKHCTKQTVDGNLSETHSVTISRL